MRALLVASLLAAAPAWAAPAEPQVHAAWVALAPPGAPVTAGYFVLDNPGPDAVSVVAVASPDFARVEMHETVQHGGRARMVARPSLAVAAGTTLDARPGGVHLMLHGARRALAVGAQVELTFRLADGRVLHARAEVRDRRTDADHAHHH